jgi:hypothetical protein
VLDSVEPATVVVGERVPATIAGANFHHGVRVQIDDDKPAVVQREWAVAIGDVSLDPTDVVYVSPTRIDLVIPDTLVAGDYDLTVFSPLGEQVSMPDAIHVWTGAMADAGTPNADAAFTGSFGPAMLIAELSDPLASDDDPTLTADLLEIYFDSNRAGSGDIWMSKRPTVSDPWAAPSLVVELSTADSETTPTLAPNGLTIYIASQRPSGLGGDAIWKSTRTSRADPWTAPVYVTELDSLESDNGAAPDAALLQMVLTSHRNGGGADLFRTSRASTSDPWDTPTFLTELNTLDSEANAHLSPNGLVLTFSSNRPGGAGASDLYITSRASLGDPFDPPIAIVELASASSDADPWLSGDGSTMFFSSDRTGNSELYVATRGP